MRYRKKPVEVDVIYWDGKNDTASEIDRWTGGKVQHGNGILTIDTLEGRLRAEKGDYIIKGVAGEIYPCKPDIFHQTYEIV